VEGDWIVRALEVFVVEVLIVLVVEGHVEGD